MKSSTVRRSALSKESIEVIGNLANDNSGLLYTEETSQNADYIPNEYVRPSEDSDSVSESKSKEIDMLWQGFKSTQFSSNSPLMHTLGGFLAGVILTLAVLLAFGLIGGKPQTVHKTIPESEEQVIEQTIENEDTQEMTAEEQAQTEEKNIEENSATPEVGKTKKYVIKDGDTVEKIIRNEYGSYSQERAEAIMKANNLSNLDHISIDQVLLLPVEK